MKNIKLLTISMIALALFTTQPAMAITQDLFKSRTSGGQTTQWTLVDWMRQKNAMSLMNQWLVLNSSSPLFDISASASGQRYKLKSESGSLSSSQTQNSQTYNLDMYISIFGIHGEYEKTDNQRESYGGSAGFRLLGSSSRSTFLAVHYGIRVLNDLDNLEKWQNQFAQGELQLYIVQSFGLTAKYRHYFPADSNRGNRLEGHRATAGLFFDVLIFRIYGNYFQEPMTITSSGVQSTEDRTGYDYGIRLFF